MSGHSKWSQIKRQKGLADAKKGIVFTKIAKAITIAVKQGGGIADPQNNFKLRLILEKARSVNMPKDNIQRAIERALGKGSEGDLEEVVYEGFTPGKAAVLVEAVTDNRLRTQNTLKTFFDKNAGVLAGPGAVSYFFTAAGVMNIDRQNKTIDDIFLLAADCDAVDLEESGETVDIYTQPNELHVVKEKLVQKGLKINSCELTMRPNSTVTISDKETASKVVDFLEGLEELDDVQRVYCNAEIVC